MKLNISSIILALVLGCLSHLAIAGATDSTGVLVPHVKVKLQPYVLAQGSIIKSTGNVDSATTADRCIPGTDPLLRTSLIETELNTLAAVQGIINTLQLRSSDYHIVGVLYMSNQVVSNSYASANWQIWCEPSKSA